jgi:hypothetical protein
MAVRFAIGLASWSAAAWRIRGGTAQKALKSDASIQRGNRRGDCVFAVPASLPIRVLALIAPVSNCLLGFSHQLRRLCTACGLGRSGCAIVLPIAQVSTLR